MVGDHLKEAPRAGSLVDNSGRDVCKRGHNPLIGLGGVSRHVHHPATIAIAFAVLCGQYGDVTRMVKDRERAQQSLYREAEQVTEAVDGPAALTFPTNSRLSPFGPPY